MKNSLVFGLLLILASCVSYAPAPVPIPNVDFNFPYIGISNNAPIAVKDYEIMGIITVKSSELIDGNGNHTGSKITNEMLLSEAKKLGAHDVINVRIDVNQNENFTLEGVRIRTTYNYTATALAIKYTTTLAVAGGNNFQSIGNNEIILNWMGRTSQSSSIVSNQIKPVTTAESNKNIKTNGYTDTRTSEDELGYTVESVSGLVQWRSGNSWVDVKVGDVFSKDTRINVFRNSSLVLINEDMTFNVLEASAGSIDFLLKNRLKR